MRIETDLKGIIAAAVTPVTSAGDIDVGRLTQHCRALLADGCSFVSTFGTTGEGASFSAAQKIDALDEMANAGFPMAAQIPAVMACDMDGAGQLLAAIARHHCRGALILPPFYYGAASEAGIVAYFAGMLARAGTPRIDLLLYNIPAMSRIAFTSSLIDLLIEHFGRRIVGVKDSTGDIANGELLARRFADLSIFTGDDRVLPDLLRAGGAGMIGGMPNLFARDLMDLMNDLEGPRAAELVRLCGARILAIDSNGSLLALKSMLACRYDDPGFARAAPPLVALEPDRVEALAEVLRAIEAGPG